VLGTRLRLRHTAALIAPLAAAFALAGAPAANASLLGCGENTSNPFAQWGDDNDYVYVSNGGVEAGSTGWSLSRGAAVVSGNEPFSVHGAGDSHSLYLPPGASAVSPPVCVGLDSPTVRFFAKGTTSGLFNGLKVDVLFKGPLGLPLSLPVTTIGSQGWYPTDAALNLGSVAQLLGLQGLTSNAQFRFTSQGSGTSFQIDDLYVDPWKCI
jgi:hypothetical protein